MDPTSNPPHKGSFEMGSSEQLNTALDKGEKKAMMTKTLDSNISELLQDNSQAEYVDAQKSPIATIPNDERSPRNFGMTFSCDVDGNHTEITIPSNAWDFENETSWPPPTHLGVIRSCSGIPNCWCSRIAASFILLPLTVFCCFRFR